MSGKIFFAAALLGTALLGTNLYAGERTIPVDLFLMVDKSLSMAEDGKFESLHAWASDHLVTQMLIPGDRISVWEFYGRSQRVLDMVIPENGDTSRIIEAIDRIVPDGEYTDIGLALDTIREAIAGWGDPDRLKILYMLTDLKQEAPWSSRYAGVEERYESPYLAEARILTHGNWFEITLDMDIQDQVVAGTKKLYESILQSSTDPREQSFAGASDPEGFAGRGSTANGSGSTAESSGSPGDGSAGTGSRGAASGNSGSAEAESGGKEDSGDDDGQETDGAENGTADSTGSAADRPSGPLPLIVGLVILCLAAAGLGIVIMRAHSRKKRKEESEPSLDR